MRHPSLIGLDDFNHFDSKAKALRLVRSKIFEAEKAKQAAAMSRERKQAIGSGDRNERIRTYNFPQARFIL